MLVNQNEQRVSRRRKVLVTSGLMFYGLLGIFPLLLSLVLLFSAETFAGRLFAIDALLLLALPVLLGRALMRKQKGRFRLSLAVTSAAIVLYVALAMLAPSGTPWPGSGAASRYPMAPYQRFSVANLLPEIDQIKLGTYLVAFVDPLIDWPAAAHLREVCLNIYRPMEQDPGFRALGSAMRDAYFDVDSGHLYEYVPVHAPGERLPAVVFLHGSAGNFKGYLWVWRLMADAMHFVVVAPSFGFGNWNKQGGTAAIERARLHAINNLHADPDRVFLAGLSNGGKGVTRAIAQLPAEERRYAGVMLFSAVVEPDIVRQAPGFRGLPVLLIHAEKDNRIPMEYAQAGLDALGEAGAKMTVKLDSREDHFLFFAQATEIAGWVDGWLSNLLGHVPQPSQ